MNQPVGALNNAERAEASPGAPIISTGVGIENGVVMLFAGELQALRTPARPWGLRRQTTARLVVAGDSTLFMTGSRADEGPTASLSSDGRLPGGAPGTSMASSFAWVGTWRGFGGTAAPLRLQQTGTPKTRKWHTQQALGPRPQFRRAMD